MYEYEAKLHRVVDGDTIELEIDLGFNIRHIETFRLYGINAPERFTTEGKAATVFLNTLTKDKKLIARTLKDKKDKYGRYLVTLIAEDDLKHSISERMVDKFLAEYKEY